MCVNISQLTHNNMQTNEKLTSLISLISHGMDDLVNDRRTLLVPIAPEKRFKSRPLGYEMLLNDWIYLGIIPKEIRDVMWYCPYYSYLLERDGTSSYWGIDLFPRRDGRKPSLLPEVGLAEYTVRYRVSYSMTAKSWVLPI